MCSVCGLSSQFGEHILDFAEHVALFDELRQVAADPDPAHHERALGREVAPSDGGGGVVVLGEHHGGVRCLAFPYLGATSTDPYVEGDVTVRLAGDDVLDDQVEPRSPLSDRCDAAHRGL